MTNARAPASLSMLAIPLLPHEASLLSVAGRITSTPISVLALQFPVGAVALVVTRLEGLLPM